MPTEYVLDASALAKTFRLEENTEAFRTWVEAAVLRGDRLLAPALVAHELRSAAIKSIREGMLKGIDDAIRATEQALALVEVAEVDGHAQIRIAVGARISAYDAAYVALAGTTRPLVTYDLKQKAAAAKAVTPGLD